MADIIYSWKDLEENLLNSKVGGFLHGEKTRFNEYKDRSPNNIWIVRLEQGKLWLLACLRVTGARPKHLPPLKKNHIFYDPDSSFFFADPASLQQKVVPSIEKACARMQRSNMQGAGAADLLEPDVQKLFESATKDAVQISLPDFLQRLRVGKVPVPPYRLKAVGQGRKSKNLSSTTLQDPASPSDPNTKKSQDPEADILLSFEMPDGKNNPVTLEEDEQRRRENQAEPTIPASLDTDKDGPNYQADPEKRKCTEDYAVRWAKENYEGQGFFVIERGKPFDLLCTKPDLTVHVEVKGTTGSAETVTLTRNEVADARLEDWRSDLFIVRNIVLTSVAESWQASGGNELVFEAWQPKDKDLDPTEYEYQVPRKP